MLYKGVYARVENDIRVHWFIGVGSILNCNKAAVKKYLKFFIILFNLVGTKNLLVFLGDSIKNFVVYFRF